jgi:trimethylamine:corrinoid methyltransferase-like protein
VNSKIVFFSQDDLELMRERVNELLDRRGVKIDHTHMRKLLVDAGARVDANTQRVCFPKALVEERIGLAPKTFVFGARNKALQKEVPCQEGTFLVRTGTGAYAYIEPKSGVHRGVRLADVASMARLADELDHVDIFATPTPSDVPVQAADVHAIRTVLQNIHKNVCIQPYSQKSIEYLIKLVTVASGGEKGMKTNPVASMIACSLSPLEFKEMDAEIMIQASRQRVPIFACSLPSSGGTAPITMPAVVLLAAAEILAMVVMSQVIQPGAPIIATPIIYALDMATGRANQSTAEALQGSSMAVQFMKTAFGLPTNATGSGCDSPELDGQSMIERTLHTLLLAASGVDIIGNAAALETAKSISPVQLVVDNEIGGMVKRIVSRPTFSDDTMAWEDLLRIDPGGQFLTSQHTLRHCRDAFQPRSFVRQDRETFEDQGKKDLVARATELYETLLKEENPSTMSDDMVREMDSIIKSADAHIAS